MRQAAVTSHQTCDMLLLLVVKLSQDVVDVLVRLLLVNLKLVLCPLLLDHPRLRKMMNGMESFFSSGSSVEGES